MRRSPNTINGSLNWSDRWVFERTRHSSDLLIASSRGPLKITSNEAPVLPAMAQRVLPIDASTKVEGFRAMALRSR